MWKNKVTKIRFILINKIKFVSSRRIKPFFKQLTGTALPTAKPVIAMTEVRDSKLVVSGRIMLNYTPQKVMFIVRKFREETFIEEFPLQISAPITNSLRGWIGRMLRLTYHDFTVVLDFPWADSPSSIFGTAISVDDNVVSFRTLPEALQILSDDQAGRTYCVFIEPSVRVLRIEMYHFGSDVVEALKTYSESPRAHELGVVLGEYTNTARDNGRALFEWLRANAPDVQASYVIEPNNLDEYDTGQPGVVAFGSRAHLERCLDARVCAFTHHRGYIYPSIVNMIAPDRYNATRTIFMQHGVTAMKRSVATHYNRNRVGYSAVLVCSQMEHRIFCDHFSYEPGEVCVTGFPRHDNLLRKAKDAKVDQNQVLFFPTWRPGLEKMTTEAVADHAFFVQWKLAMKGVADMGLRRVLILHPMLYRHQSLFEGHVDEIRKPTSFQDSLVRSACLVTDYSSVSFDALFLKKPVFLLQFDQEEFGLREEAFIDVDTQLPGHASLTVGLLLQAMKAAKAGDWAFDLNMQRDLYFDYGDDQNSARVLNLIRTLGMAD
jgi:hypothetical protein